MLKKELIFADCLSKYIVLGMYLEYRISNKE
jgi:hypothetical protein